MSKLVAVYIRVSTEDQEEGIASQEKAIQDYLDGHGYKAKWYSDRISGAKSKRPGLDRLERDIFMGKYDTVIVWSLCRLTRKGARDGLSLLQKWLDKGVRVVSISEQFDFYGATGELVASVLFSIAKMYREALRENTKRGLRAAKARGAQLGKRPVLFAKDIIPLLRDGMSMPQAARHLGKSRQALYDALQREGITPEQARQPG